MKLYKNASCLCILFASLAFFLCAFVVRGDTPTSASATQPVSELDSILEAVRKSGGDDVRMYAWLMNSEHLFVGIDDETLRDRVIAFSRKKGNLDLVFDRLSSKDTKPSEIIMCAEILVYYGEYDLDKDDEVACNQVPDYEKLIASSQISKALAAYPDAPIKEALHLAIKKASEHHLKETKK